MGWIEEFATAIAWKRDGSSPCSCIRRLVLVLLERYLGRLRLQLTLPLGQKLSATLHDIFVIAHNVRQILN